MMGARVMTKASIARAPRASVVVLADDDAIPIISVSSSGFG